MPSGSDAFAGVQQSVGHQVGGDQGSGGGEDKVDDVEDDEDDDHDDVFTSDGPLATKKSLDRSPLMIFSTCDIDHMYHDQIDINDYND